MSFASPFPEVEIPSTGVYDFLFTGIDDAHLDRVGVPGGVQRVPAVLLRARRDLAADDGANRLLRHARPPDYLPSPLSLSA